MKTLKRIQNLVALIGFWVAIARIDGTDVSGGDYVASAVIVSAVILMLLSRHVYENKVRED